MIVCWLLKDPARHLKVETDDWTAAAKAFAAWIHPHRRWSKYDIGMSSNGQHKDMVIAELDGEMVEVAHQCGCPGATLSTCAFERGPQNPCICCSRCRRSCFLDT